MKHLAIKTIFFSTLACSLVACLKEGDMNTDPDTAGNTIEFANTGNNLAAATSQYPGYYTDLGTLATGASANFNINVSYSGAGNAPEDITVNLGVDTAFLRVYNTQNGTHYVDPPKAIYNLPATAVIKKGTRSIQVKAAVTNNASFDFAVNYALALKITSASAGVISSNFGKSLFSFGVRNVYDGHYSLKGYSLRSGDAAKTGNFVRAAGMDLVTVGGNIVQFGELQVWADLTGVGIGNPTFTINTDNSVTVNSSGGAYNAPGYNCRYVPAEKTFYVSFSWGAGPAARLATDTLTYIGPR